MLLRYIFLKIYLRMEGVFLSGEYPVGSGPILSYRYALASAQINIILG